jgi:hypothetical protein
VNPLKTQTPNLDYTVDLLYMLANVSTMVPIDWYLGTFSFSFCSLAIMITSIILQTGIPFYDPGHLQLQIADLGAQILGDHLIGLQVGNEPDLYSAYVLLELDIFFVPTT